MSDLNAVRDLPSWHPPRHVLELAELVVHGALTALPQPVTAAGRIPAEVLAVLAGGGEVVLEDAEGTPVAVLAADGAVRGLQPFTAGPLRAARRSPEQVREQLATPAARRAAEPMAAPVDEPEHGTGAGQAAHPSPDPASTADPDPAPDRAPVLAVPVTGAPTAGQVDELVAEAANTGAVLLWMPLVGEGRVDLDPPGLLRAVTALAGEVAGYAPGVVVPVALPRVPGLDAVADRALIAGVARAYGAVDVIGPVGTRAEDGQAPEGPPHPVWAAELERAALAVGAGRRGVTVFFTGLSGSGKSTVAKALAELVEAEGSRTVSLLDGDEVRRMLSAGLGFSRADRDLNILRIGFVAAEVTRHGGMAICAPIAPFDATRRAVRELVEAVGDLVLVHVSTPLAECERRDRKGLYAKARAGLVEEFTGISSPYEEPADADLRLDTSQLTVAEAVAAVAAELRARGHLSADG